MLHKALIVALEDNAAGGQQLRVRVVVLMAGSSKLERQD